MTGRTSLVSAGDGIADPDEVNVYRELVDESPAVLVFEWDGNGYDERDCWIQADIGSFRGLDEVV